MNQERQVRRLFARGRRRLTYANVMATIAVFGVLAGGGAYAASKIGPNDIAKNAVRAKHVSKSAVTTPKIKNRAVTAAKLADGALSQVMLANFNGLGAGPAGSQNMAPVGVSSTGTFREMLTPQAFVATGLRVRLDGPIATGSREFVLRYFDYDANQHVITDLRCEIATGEATCGSDERALIPAESSIWFRASHTGTSETDYAEVGWRALPR